MTVERMAQVSHLVYCFSNSLGNLDIWGKILNGGDFLSQVSLATEIPSEELQEWAQNQIRRYDKHLKGECP